MFQSEERVRERERESVCVRVKKIKKKVDLNKRERFLLSSSSRLPKYVSFVFVNRSNQPHHACMRIHPSVHAKNKSKEENAG